jgi:hypothetical protein
VLVAADGHGGGKEQNDGEREERRPGGAHCTLAVLMDTRLAMLQPRTQCWVSELLMMCTNLFVGRLVCLATLARRFRGGGR